MIQIPTFKFPLWPQICVCKERSQINQRGSGALAWHIWATQSTPRHINNGKSFPWLRCDRVSCVTLISILIRPSLHWPGALAGSDSRSSDREIVIQVRSRPWPSLGSGSVSGQRPGPRFPGLPCPTPDHTRHLSIERNHRDLILSVDPWTLTCKHVSKIFFNF